MSNQQGVGSLNSKTQGRNEAERTDDNQDGSLSSPNQQETIQEQTQDTPTNANQQETQEADDSPTPTPEQQTANGAFFSKTSIIVILILAAAMLGAGIGIGYAITKNTASYTDETTKNEASSPVGSGGDVVSPMPVPTRLPTIVQTRREAISKLVTDLAWTTSEDVNNRETPQFLATVWLADEDPLRLEVEDTLTFRQRYALAVLYFSMSGKRWYNSQLPFLNGDDVCAWNMQVENQRRELIDVGVRCDDGGMIVKELYLAYGDVDGGIPDEIRLLNDLESIHMQGNDLVGQLSDQIAALPNLRVLDVSANLLSGSIPEFIGFMNLRLLNLSNNRFGGSLPPVLTGLKNMETLSLAYNDLIDNISKFSVMEEVKNLDLSNNSFTGTLTESLLTGWPAIEILDLSDNMLEGALPESLFKMENLTVLDLHGNNMDGQLPAEVMLNSSLSFLSLFDNDLDGPTNICNQLTNLKHLDLSDNAFSGDLPLFGKLTNLNYLFMSFNFFEEGPIPETYATFSNLVDLGLQHTSRIGTIPVGLGRLKNLVLLDLSNNNMTGHIPDDLGLAYKLQFLQLNRNRFNGTLPVGFRELQDLRVLLVDRNDLVGPADNVCAVKPENLDVFIADCDEINCPLDCCTSCCEDENGDGDIDSTPNCNDQIWSAPLDPFQQYEYQRTAYQFMPNSALYAVTPWTFLAPTSSPTLKPTLPGDPFDGSRRQLRTETRGSTKIN